MTVGELIKLLGTAHPDSQVAVYQRVNQEEYRLFEVVGTDNWDNPGDASDLTTVVIGECVGG